MQQTEAIKDQLRHALLHQNIQHITLETETKNSSCSGEDC
jgi:hypothetical protein